MAIEDGYVWVVVLQYTKFGLKLNNLNRKEHLQDFRKNQNVF